MGWYEEEMNRLDRMVERSREDARRTDVFGLVVFITFVAFAAWGLWLVATHG